MSGKGEIWAHLRTMHGGGPTGGDKMNYNNKGGFRERVMRFMSGRYGPDTLYHVIFWVCVGLIVINLFAESIIISIIELGLFGWAIFRVMSRNVYKRQRENQIFMSIVQKVRAPFVMMGNKWRDRKTHVYKKCPKCKSNLRMPRDKGKHSVRCPRCSNLFDVKIR